MDFDVVIQGGSIIDGTGGLRFPADIGVRKGRIEVIATPGSLTGERGRTVFADGLCVAPGFVDIHSHTDWVLTLPDHEKVLAPMVAQGITTVVTGNCGHSPAPVTDRSIPHVEDSSETLRDQPFPYEWRTMGEFLGSLDRGGLLMNAAFLIGHGTLRQAVMGNESRAPSPAELAEMGAIVKRSIREGAFGLSAGLAYSPGVFAKNDELVALVRSATDEGGLFTVHGRAYVWISPIYQPVLFGPPHNVRSVNELLAIAKASRAKIQLSHQIFIGRRTWPTLKWVMRAIERARDEGVDVGFDAFPYTFGNTTINAILPDWVLDNFAQRIREPATVKRLHREFTVLRLMLGLEFTDIRILSGHAPELMQFEGQHLGEVAKHLGISDFEAYIHVARVSDGKARVLIGTYSGDGDREEPLRAVLSHPLCAIETDSILTRSGHQNPASFGTFPRVLGLYSRDLGLFSLEEAVRKMTSLPAERAGLPGVGRIAPGYRADFVVFDPETVADNTPRGGPPAAPSGIKSVMIAGETVVLDGALVGGPRRGRVLYH
jgi:N-acyl-D-amino-acid deacylase